MTDPVGLKDIPELEWLNTVPGMEPFTHFWVAFWNTWLFRSIKL